MRASPPAPSPGAAPAASGGLWALAALVALLIVHGSLYPWRFAEPASFDAALARTLGAGPLWTGRGDVLGNIALFVPLGLLLPALVAGTRRPAAAWLGLLAAAFALAWGVQFVQIWVPQRSPAWSDAVWNMVGLGLGGAGGGLARAGLQHVGAATRQALGPAVMLAGLWLALQWWPFVPTLDWQHMKDALKPLLLTPQWRPASLAEHALAVLVVAHGLRGLRWRAAGLVLLLGGGWAGKLFIAGQALSASAVAGGLAGAALAWSAWRLPEHRATATAVLLAWLWFTVDALRPYELADAPSDFSWLPFVALLHGDLFSNLLALLWNAFWTGAVLVTAAAAGHRVGALGVALALWVLLLEAAQAWLTQRVADITPVLLPLMWLLVLRAVRPAPPRAQPPRRAPAARAA